ncbi:CDPK-related protein kinase [Aphelenchoides avenae]|nr:CDPK-related protein kinase [Aphelenchus avenae]
MEYIENYYNPYPGYWLDTREKLGQGRVTRCKVYKGYRDDEDGEDVAIKRFPMTNHTEEETFRRECEVMEALSGTCNSLVSMYDSFRGNHNDVGYICMEYCEKGDLRQYLNQKGGTLLPRAAKYIFRTSSMAQVRLA